MLMNPNERRRTRLMGQETREVIEALKALAGPRSPVLDAIIAVLDAHEVEINGLKDERKGRRCRRITRNGLLGY